MPTTAVTLRVYVGGMRWKLSDTDKIEVWKGTEQIGTLTGGTLTFLVQHLLLTADMVSWVRGTPTPIALPAPPRLPAAPKRPTKIVPPSSVPFTSAERADKATRRRARRRLP